MTFEIVPSKKLKNIPTNMSGFVSILRKYKQSSIVKNGTNLLWYMFSNKKDLPEFAQDTHLINAFGARIVTLALATTTEHRDKRIETSEDFYNLCNKYLHIPSSLNNQKFLELEASKIVEELLLLSKERNCIPDKYISYDLVRNVYRELFISRGVANQHPAFLISLQEFYRNLRIIQLLDKTTNNIASEAINKRLKMSPLEAVKSGFLLFAQGLASLQKGEIYFDDNKGDPALLEKFGVDVSTCLSLALKMSYNETDLRSEWYEGMVLNYEEMYQAYVPDPLYKKPIIHRNKESTGRSFLIPSPNIYIRGFRETLFTEIYKGSDKSKDIGSILGIAIEDHIYEALQHIFGESRVNRLKETEKHADFHVVLNKCDLVIETKTAIGSQENKMIMDPSHLSIIWNKFYAACLQCSSSMKKYKNPSKKTICIVLVADDIVSEQIPFHAFAERSGILRDLEIDFIKFISWNALEHIFSFTSVEKFEEDLLVYFQNYEDKSLIEKMNLPIGLDKPSHNYEYLRDVENLIFKNII